MIPAGLVELATTVRGVRLVAARPDARYRRYHTDVVPHPDEVHVGRAVRVEQPARLADGTGSYPAGEVLYPLRGLMRDGSDAHVTGTGRWNLLEAPLPAGDPELIALRAELDALDRAWQEQHTTTIAAEDRRTTAIAAATIHDESGRDPDFGRADWTALECLECGAVYPAPGSVEPGGMGCRRCGMGCRRCG